VRLSLAVNSDGLSPAVYVGLCRFSSNDGTALDTLEGNLNVRDVNNPAAFGLLLPIDGDSLNLNDSTAAAFSWRSLPNPFGGGTHYQLWMAAEDSAAVVAEAEDTTATVDFSALDYDRLHFHIPDNAVSPVPWWIRG